MFLFGIYVLQNVTTDVSVSLPSKAPVDELDERSFLSHKGPLPTGEEDSLFPKKGRASDCFCGTPGTHG